MAYVLGEASWMEQGIARDRAVTAARTAAKQAAFAAKALPMREKGASDAKAGTYKPPPASPPPDFDTANYQAGWLSTGKSLPANVARVSYSDENKQGGGKDSTPLIVGGVVLAAVAFFALR